MDKKRTKSPTRPRRERPLDERPLADQIEWARVHNPSGLRALEARLEAERTAKHTGIPHVGEGAG